MFSTKVAVLVFLVALHGGECVVTWTTPSGGTGTLATTVAEQQVTPETALTDLTVVAAATSPQVIASYAIVVNSNDLFTISGTTTGQLQLGANKGIDYESQTSHILVISADDNTAVTALSGTATVTITITNVETDPVFTALSFCAVVADFAVATTTVITIAASDPQSDTLTYTIDPTTDFEISSAGLVTVKTGVTFNRGTAGTYTVAIMAADSTQTGTATLTVCVGSSTQCSSCSSCSGAAAVTFSLLSLFIALLVFLR